MTQSELEKSGYILNPKLKCPISENWIWVNESTGDWACNNFTCVYSDGAQALFEKLYIKNYKGWVLNKKQNKAKNKEVTVIDLIERIRVLENQLFDAKEVITELTKPEVNLMWKMGGISWLARRAKYESENP